MLRRFSQNTAHTTFVNEVFTKGGNMLIYLKHLKAMLFNGSLRSRVASLLGTCIFSVAMIGCGLLNVQPKPTSLGEVVSGYTYIPIDPTKVQIEPGECAIIGILI